MSRKDSRFNDAQVFRVRNELGEDSERLERAVNVARRR